MDIPTRKFDIWDRLCSKKCIYFTNEMNEKCRCDAIFHNFGLLSCNFHYQY